MTRTKTQEIVYKDEAPPDHQADKVRAKARSNRRTERLPTPQRSVSRGFKTNETTTSQVGGGVEAGRHDGPKGRQTLDSMVGGIGNSAIYLWSAYQPVCPTYGTKVWKR